MTHPIYPYPPGVEFAEDALSDFRYVLEEYPSMLRAHLNVYALHRRLGNWKDAEWALAQVQCRMCGHTVVWGVRAMSYGVCAKCGVECGVWALCRVCGAR